MPRIFDPLNNHAGNVIAGMIIAATVIFVIHLISPAAAALTGVSKHKSAELKPVPPPGKGRFRMRAADD